MSWGREQFYAGKLHAGFWTKLLGYSVYRGISRSLVEGEGKLWDLGGKDISELGGEAKQISAHDCMTLDKTSGILCVQGCIHKSDWREGQI